MSIDGNVIKKRLKKNVPRYAKKFAEIYKNNNIVWHRDIGDIVPEQKEIDRVLRRLIDDMYKSFVTFGGKEMPSSVGFSGLEIYFYPIGKVNNEQLYNFGTRMIASNYNSTYFEELDKPKSKRCK